jgi:hypothetical protein
VSTLLGTRASTASLTAGLALKQDQLGQTLTLGALVVDGAPDAALVKHDEGVALQTADGVTYGVFSPAGATLRKLVVQEEIVVPDNSIQLQKVSGLQQSLDDARDIRASLQGQISGNALALGYTKLDLTDLTAVVADKASTAELTNGLLKRATVSSLVQGLATKQDKLDSFSNLDVASVSVSGNINAGTARIYSGAESVPLEVGSATSFLRATQGHHLDSYSSDGVGRDLYLCYFTQKAVRIGANQAKLAIGCPVSNFQLDLNGAMRASSFIEATKFQTTSDKRIKSNIEVASVDECTRLVKAVHPMLYTRNDMDNAPRLGYIAQDWDKELTGGYRCIMGASEDETGPLLALDYIRITVILHAALLSALARIDALESRL